MSDSTDPDLVEVDEENLDVPGDQPGIVALLGELKPGAILTEEGVARLFNRHPASVRRAVRRGELPSPMKLFDSAAWTAGSLTRFFEARLTAAEKEALRTAQELVRLSP